MTNALINQHLTAISPQWIKRGDHDAFLNMYNQLHGKVFRFFTRRAADNYAVEELTQQTFIRLWQFRETLSCELPLEKQVFVIAHSLLVNYFAKVAVQQKVKKYYRRLHTTENSSGDHGQTFERKNQVSTALNLLPPARKKILILKAVHDYSNHDIARQLNISVKTVEDHVSKAFRRIKQAMLSLV